MLSKDEVLSGEAQAEELVAQKMAIRERQRPYRFGEIVANHDGESAINRSIEILNNHTPDAGSLRIAMFDVTNHRILNALDQALERGCSAVMIARAR